ncbi:hydroxymethylbilane synthase [Balneolaceae bacterium YR4-1]|uniref:Porphobilinogen deaminase n=1 Tax=Halalkalibaculum roseum TaxID=2709311 RepID=A0A6M1SXU2_9BACT|nr:hydroxymethylbilane synthase [Halalkalibaculum roseum]NGP75387.1 hydroxymethylbilane synthase [Halalkalibaculum roseum]
MSSSKNIRIGTRDSELATWQAKQVAQQLNKLGHNTELIFVKSEGDLDLTTPLTEMGGKGVFTKALDNAMLKDEIDIAVHSFKDLPTENPLPLKVAAILERADPRDTLVTSKGTDFLDDPDYRAVIATGSNRRKAQWLNRYPNHEITNIRGNVNTRLEKVASNQWDGAIFAAAGLTRIDLDHHIDAYLDWMVPAAAQGAMAVMIREDDGEMEEVIRQLNHDETALCTTIERDFLHEMEAGCSAPVGAYANIEDGEVHFKAVALTLDGEERFDYEHRVSVGKAGDLGLEAAQELLEKGAIKVIEEIRLQ